VSAADLAIITALIFVVLGTLPTRLERFDMTAPIVFTSAGVLLTHGPLRPLRVNPSEEVVKVLAEATLALVLFSDACRIGLRHLRADQGLCLQRLDSAPSRRHWQEERCPRPGLAQADITRMRDQLFFDGPERTRLLSRFWPLLPLSAVIASAGVVSDSTATVIGAMIVAPLMTPILGIVITDRSASHL
jgi:hypothetical protein